MFKRFSLIALAILLFSSSLSAADSLAVKAAGKGFPFSIKAYPFRGMYLDAQSTHWQKFGALYPAGMHMGVEFPSTQQRPWQQYLCNPTVGMGVSWLDFGHDMLGHGVAIYPYILLDAIDTKHFEMRFKIGGGVGIVTEHWYTQEDQNPDHYYEPTVNTIFGSYLNAYLNAGFNLNFPITRYLAIGGELGFFHMSNGRTCMPNIGVNALYGSVGLTATFNAEKGEKKEKIKFPSQPYGWALNVTGCVGAQKPAIEDAGRFLISSLHVGAVYQINNWYGVGAGVDVFYNDAVSKYTNRSLYCSGQFDGVDCLTCGSEKDKDYTFGQKIRAGLSLNNEFKFGIVTAILDWGVYFYNPARQIYNDYHSDYHKLGQAAPKRKLFYTTPHGAGCEEAFHYIRLGAKCRVWDNIYLKLAMKCHLQIAEYIEAGIGYQIPFLKKGNRKAGESIIYHHHKEWWKD